MKTQKKLSAAWAPWNPLPLLLLLLLGIAGFSLRAMDENFATLRAGNLVFSNATVLNKTKTDIFIQHSSGLTSLKIKDVDPEVLRQLGYQVETPEEKAWREKPLPEKVTSKVTEQFAENPQLHALEEKWAAEVQPKLPPFSRELAYAVLAGFLALYLFFSYCCMLIVRKSGNKPGVLVWLPVLQMIPMFKAAGMSGWWFVAWLLPVLNIVAGVVWCFKIVETRGKSLFWAIMLLLPGTSLLAFLYLAFSSGVADDAPAASTPSLLRAA